MNRIFKANNYNFDLAKPIVMGILNATPDSFSDGGEFTHVDTALSHAIEMVAAGAQIIDIGGESTRPGAKLVSADEELSRIVPIIEALKREELAVCLSIDTNKPEVMREVISLGADMINDVKGFSTDGAINAVAHSGVGLCIMHMQGLPETMQVNPKYNDVIGEVASYLEHQASELVNAGVDKSRICVDPGFGFGKTPEQNMVLLKHARELTQTYPVLFGLSRKSTLGTILNGVEKSRETASVVGALLALQNGAHIVRVHDVEETVNAIRVWHAMLTPELLNR